MTDEQTIEVDLEYLAALEFEAFADKTRGNLARQQEVREILSTRGPETDYYSRQRTAGAEDD